jgi:hypothetical protein
LIAEEIRLTQVKENTTCGSVFRERLQDNAVLPVTQGKGMRANLWTKAGNEGNACGQVYAEPVVWGRVMYKQNVDSR